MPLTLDGTNGVSAVQTGSIQSDDLAAGVGGKVLQVVQTAKTDTSSFTSSNTSFGVSGLDVSITPTAATSKFLVIYSAYIGTDTLERNATLLQRNIGGGSYSEIFRADAAGARTLGTTVNTPGNSNAPVPHVANYLDSPSTTNVLNYRILMSAESSQLVFMNRSFLDSDAGSVYRAVSTITVMEIAG